MSLHRYEQYEVTTHPSSIPYVYDGPGTPRYNGNVSSIRWKDKKKTKKRGYKFTYDDANRLTQGQTMYAGSTDFLLGGSLVSKDGMTDRYLFEGGYAKASMVSPTNYRFNFLYYNQDHLGNNREVVDSAGTVKQVTNYYPFGAPYADPAAVLNASLQPYKYNGKELDRMHGLNTYDYGARQYDPILGRWDRMDPLCEKYYNVSPYAYCHNNPVRYIDQDGKSTKVKLLEDGTYQVIGGDINDKDRNIYVYTQDENDEYTIKGESIGVSATMTSFYNSDDKNPSNRWGG